MVCSLFFGDKIPYLIFFLSTASFCTCVKYRAHQKHVLYLILHLKCWVCDSLIVFSSNFPVRRWYSVHADFLICTSGSDVDRYFTSITLHFGNCVLHYLTTFSRYNLNVFSLSCNSLILVPKNYGELVPIYLQFQNNSVIYPYLMRGKQ